MVAVCQPENSPVGCFEARTELLPERLQADAAFSVKARFYPRWNVLLMGKAAWLDHFNSRI